MPAGMTDRQGDWCYCDLDALRNQLDPWRHQFAHVVRCRPGLDAMITWEYALPAVDEPAGGSGVPGSRSQPPGRGLPS